jgi:hypothetical protein
VGGGGRLRRYRHRAGAAGASGPSYEPDFGPVGHLRPVRIRRTPARRDASRRTVGYYTPLTELLEGAIDATDFRIMGDHSGLGLGISRRSHRIVGDYPGVALDSISQRSHFFSSCIHSDYPSVASPSQTKATIRCLFRNHHAWTLSNELCCSRW